MDDTLIKKFCALCGQTKFLNDTKYALRKLLVVEGRETLDLGFICPRCYQHLEDGKTFSKPKK